MEEKKCVSNKFKIMLGILSFLIILIILVFFILFFSTPKKVVTKTEKGGNVTLSYSLNNNKLSISNAVPLSDSVAITDLSSDNYIEFSVDIDIDDADSITYELSIKKDESLSTILDDDVRIYLEKEVNGTYKSVYGPKGYTGLKKDSTIGTKKGYLVLNKVKLRKNTTDNYRLKIWLSDTASNSSLEQNYSVDVYVFAKAN